MTVKEDVIEIFNRKDNRDEETIDLEQEIEEEPEEFEELDRCHTMTEGIVF